ncbi:hypothetical protein H6G80_35685 [Nostoc sp. FACHB-87]|uniref:hypothetical protein n=1 Tax=Nostocaceae TaxID=1162 RepID=UPI001688B6E6|nr:MULTISPECIES: hypothetical protein [Nostocaceae]MBD2459358.1 hypothetical protein [Nostoc sp. FACHB-87]MBD2480349.1 hypothetical protein [Anabaena sp. FACHB-83]
MSIKPDKVQLYEQDILKLELTDSDEGSLNGRNGVNGKYNGQATSVKIFGSAGSGVTFYDDKQFRTTENRVYIEKLSNNPIEVLINKNFVSSEDKIGSGIFFGEEPGKYKWILYKKPKSRLDWEAILNIVLGGSQDVLGGNPGLAGRLISIGGVIGKILNDDNEPKSDNYRVDNCSSIKFGEPPTA